MPVDHREKAFDTAIEGHLLEHAGYTRASPRDFDRGRALDSAALISFIQETQPKAWEALFRLHGPNAEKALLDDLCKAMDQRGSLDVIRHGFKSYGRQINIAFFRPAHGLNPQTQQLYQSNRLTVTRQLHYSAESEKSIDLLLSLNGLPVATAELKNQLSGQDVENAKFQYMHDRDPRELIFQFKKRTLVHFAVDPDLVFMTTRLKGKETVFLPFNKGNNNGRGNPENPNGYRAAYLWEEVWQRDSFLDNLARFLHLEVKERWTGGKKVRSETMIFPRYHQLDSVRRMEADARAQGPGHNYLIQHSAGSGKSNSIGWLAHRLASLHNANDEKVFDSVVVITDRVVLDQQLQDTVYQFEHKHGVVQKIDENTAQLSTALRNSVPIIITTLQKFPFVTEQMRKQAEEEAQRQGRPAPDEDALILPGRKYAVIIDEAHSSQSGETAIELKGVLAARQIREEAARYATEEGAEDYEEEILRTLAKRGRQPNISFFAFTATPKYKTLEFFGAPGPDGKPQPFHLYSMRQAIEEGFILDVLKHYTTYQTYFGLIKSIEDDPNVDKRQAARALARFMTLHPYNIEQKTELMIEHFRAHTRHKIGGKAKAMVVTGSRMHAVRYKQAFDKYISDKGYSDINTLVAFSGTVIDDLDTSQTYTEHSMNQGISGREIPEKFAAEEYQVLIAADKFQTGFDQPLLHTMYVDKRLAGIQAVQTLSRLNRTHPGKEDTFVLDFYNDRDEIARAFQDYYEDTTVSERADPQQLYALQGRLDESGVYRWDEVEEFCRVFFKPRPYHTPADHSKMNAILDPAVQRFRTLRDELQERMAEQEWRQAKQEAQEEFRTRLIAFRNLYAFLSQIIPYQDSDLEKLYTYLRFLNSKLPERDLGRQYRFEDEVSLKYYRLQKISEGAIQLQAHSTGEVKGPTDVGTGTPHDEEVQLSRLIDLLNERFGTDFKPADQLFLDSIREDAVSTENLRKAALANSIKNFGYVFSGALEGLFIERMEQNEDIFSRFMNDIDFRRLVEEALRSQVYQQIRQEQGEAESGATVG